MLAAPPDAQNTVFFPDAPPSAARIAIEARLAANTFTRALTAGQRCADWFANRTFRCTATMASDIVKHDPACKLLLLEGDLVAGTQSQGANEPSGNTLSKPDLMSKFVQSWFKYKASTSEMKQGAKNEVCTAPCR
jgi:hypothetical protein